MRGLPVVLLLPALGCASTVSRLPGETPTPAGAAQGSCESSGWLVLAPTRSESVSESRRSSQPRDDGLGVYRVGEQQPESIPSMSEELGPSPILDRHAAGVRRHDDKQLVAAGLGAAGIIAVGIGTWLFATSFETTTSKKQDGTTDESQDIREGRLAGGSVLILGGFGIGIAGIIVSPNAAERAKADQARYVFLPPDDDPETVKSLVGKHNQAVRDRCR